MKVSIITVVYNNEDSIKECIECVLNQTYNDIEFIVVDGKSQDGTIDIIKKYNQKIDRFISEKDKSNYDAYNKGLALSSGEIIAFVDDDESMQGQGYGNIQWMLWLLEQKLGISCIHSRHSCIHQECEWHFNCFFVVNGHISQT